MTAARVTEGTICLRSSSHFAPTANASRMRKASSKSGADRIRNLGEYDRYGAGDPLGCRQGDSGRGKNHVWIQRRQFCRIGPHPARVTATPTVINFEVAAFDPSVLQQAQPKSCNSGLPFGIGFRDAGDQYTEPPHVVRLLRARRQRPCNYRAAEKPDEFPPYHGIYSLAENHLRESLIRSWSGRYAPHRSRTPEPMSASGQNQTLWHIGMMSAFPPAISDGPDKG